MDILLKQYYINSNSIQYHKYKILNYFEDVANAMALASIIPSVLHARLNQCSKLAYGSRETRSFTSK